MLNVLLNKIRVTSENKERIILKDIVFELDEGNIFTILGKNGTGKSTLLKSLTGLLDDRFYSVNGKVIYNNKNILTLSIDELQQVRKNEIKYIFQDSVNSFDHLKTFKYYFNLVSTEREEIEKLLGFFLLPAAKNLFKMYPYEISGGMAQRISFILALLAKPKIIFLDEPTSGIDAPIVNLVLIKLKEFVGKGNLALMVTQDIELAKNASNKIALLSENTLSQFTSPEEFFLLNLLRTEK
jgi:ABC-type glutathione transport system ATPase component